MTIKVGDRIPEVEVFRMGSDGPEPVSSEALFRGRRVALFGVPGAFTRTCSAKHLPGFVVLFSGNGPGDLGGSALWNNAFLPSEYRGVTFRGDGDPILHLSNPPGITADMQRGRLETILDLNRLRQQQHPDG